MTDIEKTVKAVLATHNFAKIVDVEEARLVREEDIVPVWAPSIAIKTCLPAFIESVLIQVLSDLNKN